MPSALKEDVAK